MMTECLSEPLEKKKKNALAQILLRDRVALVKNSFWLKMNSKIRNALGHTWCVVWIYDKTTIKNKQE